MANRHGEIEEKSAELQAFDYYLRTGWTLPPSMFESAGERKFIPYHDPTNGQFTFGPGGAGSARMISASNNSQPAASKPSTTKQPKPAAGAASAGRSSGAAQPKLDPRYQVAEMPGPANRANRVALVERSSFLLLLQITSITNIDCGLAIRDIKRRPFSRHGRCGNPAVRETKSRLRKTRFKSTMQVITLRKSLPVLD